MAQFESPRVKAGFLEYGSPKFRPSPEKEVVMLFQGAREQKYFVTFRKWEDGEPQAIIVDVIVFAAGKKDAREKAEDIAERELKGFRFVGVN